MYVCVFCIFVFVYIFVFVCVFCADVFLYIFACLYTRICVCDTGMCSLPQIVAEMAAVFCQGEMLEDLGSVERHTQLHT